MAVFNLPDGFEVPKLIYSPRFNISEHFAKEKEFTERLKAWCLKRNPSEHVGELIGFPVADGKAVYMVAALKSIQLIHIPFGDGYQYEYAHRLTKKDILQRIESGKNLAKVFGSTEI